MIEMNRSNAIRIGGLVSSLAITGGLTYAVTEVPPLDYSNATKLNQLNLTTSQYEALKGSSIASVNAQAELEYTPKNSDCLINVGPVKVDCRPEQFPDAQKAIGNLDSAQKSLVASNLQPEDSMRISQIKSEIEQITAHTTSLDNSTYSMPRHDLSEINEGLKSEIVAIDDTLHSPSVPFWKRLLTSVTVTTYGVAALATLGFGIENVSHYIDSRKSSNSDQLKTS